MKVVNINYYNPSIYRKNAEFINKRTSVIMSDGKSRKLPCINLVDKESGLTILYTGYEKYIYRLNALNTYADSTLNKRASAVCSFLNYILKKTTINKLDECNEDVMNQYLKYCKDELHYARSTFIDYCNFVCEFLDNYFEDNGYERVSLVTLIHSISPRSYFGVDAPLILQKKNRVLAFGHEKVLCDVAKKYDRMLYFAIILGLYAGLREGEIVNLYDGAIDIRTGGLGNINHFNIILTEDSDFSDYRKRNISNKAHIKRKRTQLVYPGFYNEILKAKKDHEKYLESLGIKLESGAPLFYDKHGNAMSVCAYTNRLRTLFRKEFIPEVKQKCKDDGTYMEYKFDIEAYEEQYPGAHMLRHWFSMTLKDVEKLEPTDIMTYRGDKTMEAMLDYFHENAELRERFKRTVEAYQREMLYE